MNRIDKAFDILKREKKTAFIGFLCAGDPDMDTSIACALELAKNKCDLIEIGIPFRDPVAEGPLIQEANLRALQHHITTDDSLQMVKTLRKTIQTPIIFSLYYNQMFTYGNERFMQECSIAGVDGLMIPDLPYEHQDEIIPLTKQYGIQLITFITPKSIKRNKQIAMHCEGFLHCIPSFVSEPAKSNQQLKTFISELNAYSDTPKAVNLTIPTTEQIKEMIPYIDGIIIGNAIVEKIALLAKQKCTIADVGTYVKSLSDVIHYENSSTTI